MFSNNFWKKQKKESTLTNYDLVDAWQHHNYDQIKIIHSQLNNANLYYLVDVSLEEGDKGMTQFLINNLNAQPSLYAKQMAEINGHVELAKYVESFGTFRNQASIASVHRRRGKDGNVRWSECIPFKYQFV